MSGKRLVVRFAAMVAGLAAALFLGCHGDVKTNGNGGDGGGGGTFDSGASVRCPQGTDRDGDGYGEGCPAGPDCDDADRTRNSGAAEVCDGKDNNCDGQVDEGLVGCSAAAIGSGTPFPLHTSEDANLKEADGVALDPNGDLILGASVADFGFIWIANTDDLGRGTLSKVDTKNLKEVARYYTVTCKSKPDAQGCVDVAGRAIEANSKHRPSRTAVDFNMDVWVANRCETTDCQPSASKVANDPADCIDRNKNGVIDTSADRDGNGQITTDCNGDGQPDDASTVCTGALAGKAPEFLGYDDECVLFTVNYAEPGDIARSICLNAGKATIGASDAWVGTYGRPENDRGPNLYYKLNGYTGLIEQQIEMPAHHHAYGCTGDAHNLIWSTDIGHYEHKDHGNLTYFQTVHPYSVGVVLRGPTAESPWKDRAHGRYRHYGIAVDAQQSIWVGGIDSEWVLRYRPDRTSFDTLSKGSWTRVDLPSGFYSRGVAADNRGKLWVAVQKGAILRLEQNLPEGIHDLTSAQEGKDYWNTKAQEVIGVGVDVDLNIWGVGKSNDTASRLDVDANGDPIAPITSMTKNVKVGEDPYTYSDFTGFGLRTFVRPQGRWSYKHQACPDKQKTMWTGVRWNATTPAGTTVTLRVRTGDTDATYGEWSRVFTQSPAELGPKSTEPVSPNPAVLMQVEFTLTNADKTGTPILHDYAVQYSCVEAVD